MASTGGTCSSSGICGGLDRHMLRDGARAEDQYFTGGKNIVMYVCMYVTSYVWVMDCISH